MSFSVKLSTKNFSQASKIVGNDDFHFIIGNTKVSCHKFVAAFLSRPISQILLSDPTSNTFEVSIGNNLNSEQERSVADQLNKLIFGEEIELKEEEIQKFFSDIKKVKKRAQIAELSPTNFSSLFLLSNALQNDEINEQIYRSLLQFLIVNESKSSSKETTKEEAEKKLQQIQNVENFLSFVENQKQTKCIEYLSKCLKDKYDEIVDDIASHFYEFDENVFYEMNEILLDSILSSQKLKIQSEDSLLSILINRRNHILSNNIEKIDDHQFFIEKVQFEYLSEKSVELFLNEFQFEDINLDIWSQIKKRLILPVLNKSNDEQRQVNKSDLKTSFTIIEKMRNSNDDYDGIIKYLSDKTGGNIHDNKTIEVSSNSIQGSFAKVVDPKTIFNAYVSKDSGNAYICFDFKDRKIKLSSYSLLSFDNRSGTQQLRNWVIEISDNGDNWIEIDRHENDGKLNVQYKTVNFTVQNKNNDFKRFVRLKQIGISWSGSNTIGFNKIELYGSIQEP